MISFASYYRFLFFLEAFGFFDFNTLSAKSSGKFISVLKLTITFPLLSIPEKYALGMIFVSSSWAESKSPNLIPESHNSPSEMVVSSLDVAPLFVL